MRTTIFLFMVTLLSSCGKHSDGTSVWAGGLWLVAAIPFVLALYFGYIAYRQSSDGAVKIESGWVTDKPAKKMKFYEVPYFWGFVISVLAFIVAIIAVNADK